MSETVYKIIPYRIGVIPEVIDLEKIKILLKNMNFDYEKISMKVLNNIEFVDCGENLRSVKCNHCFADAEPWWSDYMTTSFEQKYEERSFFTPCCNKYTSLEELIYDYEVGFSKFIVVIKNPSRMFLEEELQKIGDIMKCEMRLINARY